MLTRAMYWSLLVIGLIATVVPPVLSIAAVPHTRSLLGFLPFIAWFATGAFAFWRRPDHRAARRMLLTGVGLVVSATLGYGLFLIASSSLDVPSWLWVANTFQQEVEIGAYVSLVALFAVFPTGHAERAYARSTVRVLLAVMPLIPVLLLVTMARVQVVDWFAWPRPVASPLYIPALNEAGPVVVAIWQARFVLVLVAAVMLAFRYRRSAKEQRVQIMWPLFAAALFFFLGLGPSLFSTGLGALAGPLVFPLIPVSVVVGMLRYRLFDIQAVIRKSIIYGILWLAIALVYLGSAAVLGITAGQQFGVELAVVATIIAAMVFQPARDRLERHADRWVFGERLDSYALLRRFGSMLEETYDLEQLIPRVASTIREGLGVSWIRIALWRGAGPPPLGGAPYVWLNGMAERVADKGNAVAPLMHRDEVIGQLECGPKVEGSWQPGDQQLLETVGRQAALAIRNARLMEELDTRLIEIQNQARELSASRERIVLAENAGRRQIERDIHDGIQQELVVLMAKIGYLRTQLGQGISIVDATLVQLQEEIQQAVEDLRELARGIHPAVLTDRGLLEAIEARAADLPIGVRIQTDHCIRSERFAQEIEGAAYFLVCEALGNILKHASAQQATVRLTSRTPGTLSIEVTDDGTGFDPTAVNGSGLRGLKDRIEALGGSLLIASRRNEGTTLTATLPARLQNGI